MAGRDQVICRVVQGRADLIRVGFVINSVNHNWLGGVNYFKNLLEAIAALPERRIEPVILAGKHTTEDLLCCSPPPKKDLYRDVRCWNLL